VKERGRFAAHGAKKTSEVEDDSIAVVSSTNQA